MKTTSTILIVATAMLTAACTQMPKERATKTVEQYIQAVAQGDEEKIEELTYEPPFDEADVVEEWIIPTSDEGTILTVSDSDIQIPVDYIPTITGKPNVTVYDSDITLLYLDYDFAHKYDLESRSAVDEDARNLPSDVVGVYRVKAHVGDRSAMEHPYTADPEFIVYILNDETCRVASTKYVYKPDLKRAQKELGCSLALNIDGRSERDIKAVLEEVENNLRCFDIFAGGVPSGDTARLYALFNHLGEHPGEYAFKGRPVVKRYEQTSPDGKTGKIFCADTTAYYIKEGNILDCRGIVSSAVEENRVRHLGIEPKSKGAMFDIKYKEELNTQAREREAEIEREAQEAAERALAAQCKAKGVGLVSSQFSSNGKGAKGVQYTAVNFSNKTAKYIIIEVVGYNGVDDPVWDKGYIKRCRGIGPIAPGDTGTWDFDEIWENGSIVRSYEIKNLIIQFTDGSSRSIHLPRELPYGWESWLD